MDKLLSGIGLCAKAGKLIYGVPMVCEAMRKGASVRLVIESADTSENTHKRLDDKCAFYKIEKIKIEADGGLLASSVGKSGSIGAVAITDAGLTQMIKKLIDSNRV